jgi:hypothetical protein
MFGRLEHHVQAVERDEAEQGDEIDSRAHDRVGSVEAWDEMEEHIGDGEPSAEGLLPFWVFDEPLDPRRDDVRRAENERD